MSISSSPEREKPRFVTFLKERAVRVAGSVSRGMPANVLGGILWLYAIEATIQGFRRLALDQGFVFIFLGTLVAYVWTMRSKEKITKELPIIRKPDPST